MPHKKKKFTKENSVKYLLLPGNPNAQNADGETLPNIMVPISNNHKPGSSLFMPKINELCGEETIRETMEEDADLKNIIDGFDEDGCSDDLDVNLIESRLKSYKKSDRVQEYVFNSLNLPRDEDGSFSSDASHQFSDMEDDEDDLFSNFSLTSARKDCSESIKTLNERFEKVFEEYDDDQIGALDEEEICGNLHTENDRVQNLINTELLKKEEEIKFGDYDEDLKKQILAYAESDEPEKFVDIVIEKPIIEYDCESIISTYSNIYNHPTIIKEECKVKKIKVSENPLKNRLSQWQLKNLSKLSDHKTVDSEDECSITTSVNIRLKTETPEERKERKSLVREARRERRIAKKENKIAFKNEKKLQTVQAINAVWNHTIKLP